jgi:hypothetical protein
MIGDGIPAETEGETITETIEVCKLRESPDSWRATDGEYTVLGSSYPQALENFATRIRQMEDTDE